MFVKTANIVFYINNALKCGVYGIYSIRIAFKSKQNIKNQTKDIEL